MANTDRIDSLPADALKSKKTWRWIWYVDIQSAASDPIIGAGETFGTMREARYAAEVDAWERTSKLFPLCPFRSCRVIVRR